MVGEGGWGEAGTVSGVGPCDSEAVLRGFGVQAW